MADPSGLRLLVNRQAESSVVSGQRRHQQSRPLNNQVQALERRVLKGVEAVTTLPSGLDSAANPAHLADEEVVRYLSAAIGLRDDETGRHIERVSLTAAALSDWCGATFDPAPAIRLGAAMHDVGKIGIPDWVLLKPGRLTPAEMAIVRRHCELGHALLGVSDSSILTLAASIALNHHERWDGKGYPNRRGGEDIPLEARITSVADVFDALTSDRVYRAALPVETAVDIMLRERSGLFDAALLDLFLEHLDDILGIAGTLPDPPAVRITRIVVADHQRVFAAGLTQIIHRRDEMRIIGIAHSMAEAIDVVEELRPDVLLCGYRMPDGDGAQLSEHVQAHCPETKIVVLTSMATPEVAARCISAGCSGIVAKTASAEEVTLAIRRVHDGEVVIPPDLLPHVLAGLRRPTHSIGADITPRERELLGHLAEGRSLSAIAHSMSISVNTARNHTQNVIEKLGAHSKLEAVVIAMHEKLIDIS